MHTATPDPRTARDWTPFALLLIDLQRDFWPDRMAARFPSFPANVERLLAFCRAEGLEVVHLRTRFRPDMSDWMATYKLRGRTPCVDGTAGVQTLPFAVEQSINRLLSVPRLPGILKRPRATSHHPLPGHLR